MNSIVAFLVINSIKWGHHETLNDNWSKIAKAYFTKMMKGPQTGPTGLGDGKKYVKLG